MDNRERPEAAPLLRLPARIGQRLFNPALREHHQRQESAGNGSLGSKLERLAQRALRLSEVPADIERNPKVAICGRAQRVLLDRLTTDRDRLVNATQISSERAGPAKH